MSDADEKWIASPWRKVIWFAWLGVGLSWPVRRLIQGRYEEAETLFAATVMVAIGVWELSRNRSRTP